MKERIKELYESGMSCRAIGREMGLHHNKVAQVLSDSGVKVKQNKSDVAQTAQMSKLYNEGYSFEQIGMMIGLSRQATWERLKRFGVDGRAKKVLPFIMYDGIKWTIAKSHGYYRNTNRNTRGELLLHRYKYEREVGKIPNDWDVHHIDHNKTNNDIGNLKAMPKADHTKLHQELKK